MIWAEIVCDRCSQAGPGDSFVATTKRRLQREAKASGWVRRRVDGRMHDLCPACADKTPWPVGEDT